MKKATITIITSAALAFAIPLYAADEPGKKSDSQRKSGYTQQQGADESGRKADSRRQSGLTQGQAGQMMTADDLDGMKVVSQEGEDIGKISEITIDKQSGEVSFVIISKGGLLGMGTTDIAAPLSAFEFTDDEARLTVSQSKLDNVPQQTAGATESDYQRDLETHYGVAPAWDRESGDTPQRQRMGQDDAKLGKQDATDTQRQSGVSQRQTADQPGMRSDAQRQSGVSQRQTADQPGMRSDARRPSGLTRGQAGQMQADQMMTADDLDGMKVVSQEGEDIGKISEITIDKQSGEVSFVIISKGGLLGMGTTDIAAPLSAFEFTDDEARLTVSQSKLENVPQQAAGASESDYQRDLETHYGVAPAWDRDSGDAPQSRQMDKDATEQQKKDATERKKDSK